MSIFEKLFGEKTIDVINRDTKLSTTDITNFIKNDSGNIAKVHDAASRGNLDCQIFLSQISIQTLMRHENNPDTSDETFAKIYKTLERYTRLAAEQGDADSQYNLAKYYLKQVDFSNKDSIDEEEALTLKEARHWYKQAHENGHSDLSEAIASLEWVE